MDPFDSTGGTVGPSRGPARLLRQPLSDPWANAGRADGHLARAIATKPWTARARSFWWAARSLCCWPRLPGYIVAFGAPAAGRGDAPARGGDLRRGPEERLPRREAHDELQRLGETLNEMLGRSRRRSSARGRSSTTRATSCVPRWRCTRPSSSWPSATGETEEELRAAIASAIEEVDRLSALAEDLLVMARSEEGKLALHLEPCGSSDLLGGFGSDSPPGSTAPGARSWSSRPTA